MNTTYTQIFALGKWQQLKMTMLPIVAVEIQNYITEYKKIVEKIEIDSQREPESEEARHEYQELLIQYSQLRACIKARHEELQTFYDENADDEKIHFFEKLSLKLKKLLQQKPNLPRNEASQMRSDFSEDVSASNELERAPQGYQAPEEPSFRDVEETTIERKLNETQQQEPTIVFKIKLTPQEYQMIMNEKKKRGLNF